MESSAHISPVRPFRVHVHGFALFARQIPDLLDAKGWEIRSFDVRGPRNLAAKLQNLRSADLVFSYGGRATLGKFLGLVRLMKKERVVIFWAGSDILYARKDYEAQNVNDWVKAQVHWAASPWLAEEVRAIGIPCEYVPLNWAVSVTTPAPLPQKMTVLAYVPEISRGDLYGLDHLLEVARSLTQIEFVVVGFRDKRFPAASPNVKVHGWIEDMRSFYERATVLWRPVRHDGMSFMVLSALAHGRHVLWTYPFPGCIKTNGAAEAKDQLKRLRELHERQLLPINREGVALVAREFSREKTKARILARWARILDPATNVHQEEISLNPDRAAEFTLSDSSR